MDKYGTTKITDFGLSRESKPWMTQNICTCNYRAPELLFGGISYSEKVDVWSAGCTFAEMVLMMCVFHAEVPEEDVVSRRLTRQRPQAHD